ncbi:hypothetical protein KPH14_001058, partial [Odynerus spinipes]
CGKGHLAIKCYLNRNVRCTACGIRGHLQSVCFKSKGQTHNVEEVLYNATNENILQLEQVKYRDKFLTKLQVNDKVLEFEVDSGAAVTLASKAQMLRLFPSSFIHPTTLKLITYCKNSLNVEGYIICTVNTIGIDKEEKLKIILQKYKKVLEPGLDHIKNRQACLTLKDNAKPIFMKHRTVPFKLLPLVEKEIEDLEAAGILVKVNTSEWATPIVPVLKKKVKFEFAEIIALR